MSYDDASPDSYADRPNLPAPAQQTPEELAAALANKHNMPKIVFLGKSGSGKSSIHHLVFSKMAPQTTVYLPETTDLVIRDIDSSTLFKFQLVDVPGNFDVETTTEVYNPTALFSGVVRLVFVFDAQEPDDPKAGASGASAGQSASIITGESFQYLVQLCKVATAENKDIALDVLVHKIDGDSFLDVQGEEHRNNVLDSVRKHVLEELVDAGMNRLADRTAFYATSIWDHSVFEAMSKIVQGLNVRTAAALEGLLDGLLESCSMEKAFLFDVVTKIYVSTDSNPVELQIYELCSDMIDVVIDLSCIYGQPNKVVHQTPVEPLTSTSGDSSPVPARVRSKAGGATASSRQPSDGSDTEPAPSGAESSAAVMSYDKDSASTIRLNNGLCLYLRQVNEHLALVCLMKQEALAKAGLLEYNFSCFKSAIGQLLTAQSGPTAAAPAAAAAAAPSAQAAP